MDEAFTIVKTIKCGDVQDLMNALQACYESDPRGEDVGQAVAVHISNKFVHLELREFEDGTREISFTGI